MSRHKELMLRQEFSITCKIGQFFVTTDEKFVATSNVMFKFSYVVTMRNIVVTKTFLAISKSKVDYVATQRKYVMTRKFDAQVNLCCDIQKYCRDNVFLFQKHRSFIIMSRHG